MKERFNVNLGYHSAIKYSQQIRVRSDTLPPFVWVVVVCGTVFEWWTETGLLEFVSLCPSALCRSKIRSPAPPIYIATSKSILITFPTGVILTFDHWFSTLGVLICKGDLFAKPLYILANGKTPWVEEEICQDWKARGECHRYYIYIYVYNQIVIN